MTYQEAPQVAIRYGVFYNLDERERYCRCCAWNEVSGHKPDCEIAQMLEKGRE